jgi:DNA-binding NarL/FixJ family response regulator
MIRKGVNALIKVAVADDQVLLRKMLCMLLEQDDEIEVIGDAGDGKDILNLCREQHPDVVLLDIKMPAHDGIYALQAIKRECPKTKVIMLTAFGDEKNALKVYKDGADGYILKEVKPNLLTMTVKCVAGGLFVMHESVNGYLRGQVGETVTERIETIENIYDDYGLDRVDRKIIRLLIGGKTNKEIGETLNFSEGTIKNRVSRILHVTNQKDRTQLAVFALQNDLV